MAPLLLDEWHTVLNGELDPLTVLPFSNKVRWWACSAHGHDYEAVVAKRTNGRGCPYCSGKKVLIGFNDLATRRPEIAAVWDHERNGDATPQQVTEWSNKAFWWRCDQGHSWEMKVSRRSRGLGCSICSGHVVLPGYNDLSFVAPEVASTLDRSRTDMTAETIFARSRKSYPWTCSLGHTWEATAKNRVQNRSGCPDCSGNRVLVGFNDLATIVPHLVRQWHPTRNGALTPQMFTYGSTKKVWWLCENGHEWKAAIAKRRTRGCKKCALQGTSRVERELFEACTGWLGEAAHLRTVRIAGKRVSLDISGVCDGAPVAVEYDGSYFHADAVERDSLKTQALLAAGWLVVRVREENHTALEPLPLVHPRLVQVSHRFGDAVEPLSDQIRVLVVESSAVAAV
jgi:very-short-patch-repair endonuclease